VTAVEVLAPVRIETRFMAPEDRDDGVNEWKLRIRIYPDEFSIRRTVAPPVGDELDRLSEAVAGMSAVRPLPERDAFASFAASVGAARALALWRAYVMPDGAGGMTVDRSDEAVASHYAAHGPAGLPEQMEIWLIFADGTRSLAATLPLDLAAIAADLDLLTVFGPGRIVNGKLPVTWWLSYERACDLGLGADIDVGAVAPVLEAIVAVGIGDTDAAELVDAHVAGGRLAVLAAGTPTNTVAGEPTTDFGTSPESLYPLLHADPSNQVATRSVLEALTGRPPGPGEMPLLGGDLDHAAPGRSVVQGLWPALWGRALRDVTIVGPQEVDISRWAVENLMVEGPRPAVRLGEQPYGLLPTTSFAAWVDDPADGGYEVEVERHIRAWAVPWRAGAAAAAARAAAHRVHGADTSRLLDVMGMHAPNRHWAVRPVADHHAITATRALWGLPAMPLADWDLFTAAAWNDAPYPGFPIGPAARRGPVPGPPDSRRDDSGLLRELCFMHPEPLYYGRPEGLGLVGRLFREALIAGRAIIGEAVNRLNAGDPVELGQPLPLDNEPVYVHHLMQGDEHGVELLAGADDNSRMLADRFRSMRDALYAVAEYWDTVPDDYLSAVLAALDAASFRVDPWLTGVAERRLRRMIDDGAPFRLGAYGWVDAPAPYAGIHGGPLAPGPTAAGLLHAPSQAQALTAAVLRDAAVRYPGDDRWRLNIDSAKVRASVALAERVRLGVHPYEALGLEVEKVAGDWDVVRILREEYALADDQDGRRVCDGAAVLKAAREGALVAGLPADLAGRLAPLDQVLDTYADLLVADGVHALVTGRADLANAAMEAAAGLGAPPDLRALRTPRSAGTVRVAAWALLEPGPAEPDPAASPAEMADPAFATLVAAELGAGALESEDAAVVDARTRLTVVLGGGEDDPPVPSLVGGTYEGLNPETCDAALRAAMADDLSTRLSTLVDTADDELAALMQVDVNQPETGATISAFAHRWRVDTSKVVPDDPAIEEPSPAEVRSAIEATFGERVAEAKKALAAGGSASNLVRGALRELSGRKELPVLPIVDRSLLPVLRQVPDLDETWLELVAAVHPRLAPLEARQFALGASAWPAAVAAPDGSTDPWHAKGPVLVAYGPALPPAGGRVAVAALDAWTDSVPSRRHATAAAFGFNAPKSRAPQAVLLAVPPDRAQRLTTAGLVDVVLETRELAHARATRPRDRGGLPYATPTPLVHASGPAGFLREWPQ
jgi:hypothetical protein